MRKRDKPEPVAIASDKVWGTCRKCRKRIEGTLEEVLAHKCEVNNGTDT